MSLVESNVWLCCAPAKICGQQANLATCTCVACLTIMLPCRHAARPWLQELRGLCSLRQLELLDASSRDIVGQLAPLSVLSQLTRVSLGLMAAQEQPVGVLAMLFQCVPQLQSLRCCNPLETVSELKCLEVGMHCLIGLLRPSHSGHDAALEAVVLDFWLTRRGPPSCSDHDRLLGRLQEASHLTSLQLDSCQHSNAHYTIHHISVSGRSLRHLNLGQLRLRSIEVVANFHMLAFLKSLELHRCVFARQNLQLVGHVSGLSSLMVSFPLSAHLAGSMPGLELALGRFAALKSVHIEVEAEWPMPRPAFSNPGVLGHLTELQSLTLRGLMLESAILDTIQLELPNLTHLSFEDSQMPEMETFGANLKDLQSLHIGAVGPYAVLTSQSLTSLTIDVLTERQAAWAFIGVGHTLKHFRADHCRCRGAALVHQILQPLTALMSLTLCDLQPDSPDMTVACLQKFLPGVDIELHHPSGVVEAS